MLTRLIIKNVALIDFATIDFSSGLNVLSGETGSGKSVIIECLNFVLGAKAERSMIRTGETSCSVSAEFDVAFSQGIKEVFNEFDFEEDDTLIITRKYDVNGKGDIKVNGNTVSVSMLKKFTAHLVDIHGQSEHFYLLKESNQLALIDSYCGEEVQQIKNNIKLSYQKYKDVLEKIDSLGGDEKSRAIKLDIYSYQIKEIEEANLTENEEEELLDIRKKLLNQEKISNCINNAKDALEGDNGVLDCLQNAIYSLRSISSFTSELSEVSDRLENANIELKDISFALDSLFDEDSLSEYNIDYVEERLSLIKKLKKKYGSDYNEIIEFYNQIKVDYENILNFNELAEKYLIEKEKAQNNLYKLYSELSAKRKQGAKVFSKSVTDELNQLGMNNARFEICFNEFPLVEDCSYNLNGQDKLEFLFSTNTGEPLKPLAKIISGGEISRFMLAVKTTSSSITGISTFVFDEIDAGISGYIATVVAKKFAKIAKNTQVIAITHLPQISCMSDNSLLIYKDVSNGKTSTHVSSLDEDSKIKEITRLVGGTTDSAAAIEHAKNLIKEANLYKKTL